MTTFQVLGILIFGGCLGFLTCAIIQINRESKPRADIDTMFDTIRLDHLTKNARTIICTTVNGRRWWSVVPHNVNEPTATALELRDAIDSDMDAVSEFGAEAATNG